MRFRTVWPTVMLRSAMAVLLLFAPAAAVRAQDEFRLTGWVSDSSGSALAGARITAQNDATGVSFSSMSGSDGSFSIAVPAGIYTVNVFAPGFAKKELAGVAVTASATASLGVTLNRLAYPAAPASVPKPANPPQPTSPTPAHVVSGRAFLVGNTPEESGFGLYSYVLLGSAPVSAAMKAQYLSVIAAFLQLLTDVGALEDTGLPKSELNVTYLVLTEKPRENVPTAEWVLDHYNFARAKAILASSGTNLLTGPYIVSALIPISHVTAPQPLLLQNLSHVRSDVAASWVQEFERRAANKKFWAADTRNQAILSLRTFVSNAAAGITTVGQSAGDVKELVAEWITWR